MHLRIQFFSWRSAIEGSYLHHVWLLPFQAISLLLSSVKRGAKSATSERKKTLNYGLDWTLVPIESGLKLLLCGGMKHLWSKLRTFSFVVGFRSAMELHGDLQYRGREMSFCRPYLYVWHPWFHTCSTDPVLYNSTHMKWQLPTVHLKHFLSENRSWILYSVELCVVRCDNTQREAYSLSGQHFEQEVSGIALLSRQR